MFPFPLMNCKHCDMVKHKLHIQAKQNAPVIINQQCFSSASCSITLEETSNANRSRNFSFSVCLHGRNFPLWCIYLTLDLEALENPGYTLSNILC